MKKLLALFLAIASLLCQAACSSDYLTDEEAQAFFEVHRAELDAAAEAVLAITDGKRSAVFFDNCYILSDELNAGCNRSRHSSLRHEIFEEEIKALWQYNEISEIVCSDGGAKRRVSFELRCRSGQLSKALYYLPDGGPRDYSFLEDVSLDPSDERFLTSDFELREEEDGTLIYIDHIKHYYFSIRPLDGAWYYVTETENFGAE